MDTGIICTFDRFGHMSGIYRSLVLICLRLRSSRRANCPYSQSGLGSCGSFETPRLEEKQFILAIFFCFQRLFCVQTFYMYVVTDRFADRHTQHRSVLFAFLLCVVECRKET